MFREVQRLGAKVVDFFLIVEGFQRGEVDTLENGFQGFLLVAMLFLNFDDLSDALVEGGFAMVIGLKFQDDCYFFTLIKYTHPE